MLLLDNEGAGSRRGALQDFQPTLGYTVGTAAAATWADNPAVRAYDYLRGQGGYTPGGYFADDTRRLDANQASDIAKEYGAATIPVPASQFSEGAARIQYERQRQKRIAADVDQNTPYDLWETPVRALTRAAVTLADPPNLASMFIPVVGAEYTAARMAATTGALGRLGVRLEQGAIQGAVGMGALELANYPLAHAIGDDYHSTDSLVNIMTGAALGAALHGVIGGVFGKVPERPPAVRDAPPEVNIAAQQTAVAQMVQGQPTAVDHLYPKTSATGFVEAFGGMKGGGFTDKLYAGLYQALKDGETTYAGVADPILARARAPFEGGLIKGPEDLRAFVESSAQRVTWDNIAPGQSVRLYRGESAQNEVGGQWWTTDPAKAARFGAVQSVELPSETIGTFAVRGHGGADEFVFPTQGMRPNDLAPTREAIAANRERSVLDGDGLPPREEPAPPADAKVNPQLADAQARATEATQQAEAAVQALRERMAGPEGKPAEVKPPAELVAADAQIARANAEAKALEDVVNCQRLT